ncbi:unnamed protein product [Hydatigera taeniaeformis]|uniref:LisH domain-containing protein n=1 Tax=Hydatigena taeniaeformis TaxID=6205 RepID=A0A0R3WL88_HYDTA|nr:unnamed protein product [Hydatigera taeniaeformis]
MVNNVYFSLLPSEVCRLILGYLSDLGCVQTFNTFFQECSYLAELRNESQTGNKMTYRVGGFTLAEILKDYFTIANIANEKRDSIIKKWNSASLPACHPGEMAPLLVCLLSDTLEVRTSPSSSQDRSCITAPAKKSTLTPVVSVPSAGSNQRITIINPGASVAPTQNRVKIIPSAKALPSTPKVILKVVRTQPIAASVQSSSTSSSSRRKIHSKPAHVTEIESTPTASSRSPLNIQRVFCNLAENAKTVADRINSDLSSGATCESSLSHLDFPIPADIEQSSSGLLEQDMQDIISRLMDDVDSLGAKSPMKTGANAVAVATPSSSPSSSVVTSVVPPGRTDITAGVIPRGRVPVKPTSNPSFDSPPDESLARTWAKSRRVPCKFSSIFL